MYSAKEVYEILGICKWTLDNWYQWERKSLENHTLEERVLPVPIRDPESKGRPRVWDEGQVEQLRAFQKSIVHGRNGVMGCVTNMKSRRAKNK